MSNKVSYLIQLQDKFSRQAEKINRAMQKIKVATDKTAKSFVKFSKKAKKSLDRVGKQAAKTGAKILAAAAIIAIGASKAIKQSTNMEDAMADVARVVTATKADISKFEEKLETMSEALGKNKIGLAQMAFEGGKLGIALKDMEPFLDLVTKTAIAFDLQDQEAGRAIGSIRAKMGLMNKDVKILLDSINFLADNTSASGARMINIVERISGEMALLGIPPEATASLAGFADQIEVTSELAASGIRMFLSRMQRFPGMTTKLMNDPLGTVRGTLQAIAKMGPEVRAKFIQKAFGDEAGRFVKKMVSKVDLFGKTVTTAFSTKAVDSMTRELENQLNRSSKVFQRFSETGTNTMDAIGDAIKPLGVAIAKFLTPLINGIGEIAKQNPKLFQFVLVVTALAAALGTLAVVAGGIAIAIGLISAPILIVIAAISALAAVIVFWDDLKEAIGVAATAIAGFLESLFSPLASVFALGEKIGAAIGSFFTGEDIEIKSSQSLTQRSQSDVNVNLRAPAGVVESVKTRTSGKTSGLNVGVNVAEAI